MMNSCTCSSACLVGLAGMRAKSAARLPTTVSTGSLLHEMVDREIARSLSRTRVRLPAVEQLRP